jgi:hypothetical protein
MLWTAGFRNFILEKSMTHLFSNKDSCHSSNWTRTSYGPAKHHVNPLGAINIYPAKVGIDIFVQGLLKTGLFQQKNIKWWNKQYFIENITEIMQHILKRQYISFLPKYTK